MEKLPAERWTMRTIRFLWVGLLGTAVALAQDVAPVKHEANAPNSKPGGRNCIYGSAELG